MEGNALFHNALNTFYIWLYSVRQLVKDHLTREETCCLPPLHGLLFMINSTDKIAHTTAFVKPLLELWLEQAVAGKKNSSMGPP